MWYPASVSVAATQSLVLSLADAKASARIDHADDDVVVLSMVATAIDHVENVCGIRLGAQTLVVMCDAFTDFAKFPVAPVASISSITYIDTDGAQQTLAGTVYELRANQLEVSIALKYEQLWPKIQPGSRITVTCVAGYSAIPASITRALTMHVGHQYENREAVTAESMSATPMGFDDLLVNYRRYHSA